MSDPMKMLEAVQSTKRKWLRDHGKAEIAKSYTAKDWWIYRRMRRAIENQDSRQIGYYLRLAGAVCVWLTLSVAATAQPEPSPPSVDYNILAVRVDRTAQWGNRYSEVKDPGTHPVSDLVVIRPDGTEEILVSGNGKDAILDPKTIDGENVFFSRIYNCLNRRKGKSTQPASSGSDIYSIAVSTGEVKKWTDRSSNPLPGFADFSTAQHEYGVFNLGPQPLPDGRLVYTSSRRRIAPTKTFTKPNMQLHVRHPDGLVECIGVMSQGSALHPELLRDGRIAFSSYESMGLRDRRAWSLWQIHPDGTNWGPLLTSYGPTAYHFHTQRSNGKIVSTEYYNFTNYGIGTLVECGEFPTYADPSAPRKVRHGYVGTNRPRWTSYPFGATDLISLTPWSHQKDYHAEYKSLDTSLSAESVPGDFFGKVGHPSATIDNGLLVAFSHGPSTAKGKITGPPRFSVRLLRNDVANEPDDLEIVHANEKYNYTQPRALLPYSAIYGTDPVALPDKTDSTKHWGVFGSSSACGGQWKFGLDSGGHGECKSLVILGAEPNAAKIYGTDLKGRKFSSGESGWTNGINERLRILGEVTWDEPDRPEGDDSFRVKVPADVPFTVALRGEDGRFLTVGQSWKQVRPGYEEVNCGGCHNHAGEPIPNEGKYAFSSLYEPKDLTTSYRIPEFHADVKPIIDAKCAGCHNAEGETPLTSIVAKGLAYPLKAGKSKLSRHIHGDDGFERMPLGGEPLSQEEIQKIDEWIDCGCLVDGDGSAFDVFSQTIPEPEPEEPTVEELLAIINDLQKQISELQAMIELLLSLLG